MFLEFNVFFFIEKWIWFLFCRVKKKCYNTFLYNWRKKQTFLVFTQYRFLKQKIVWYYFNSKTTIPECIKSSQSIYNFFFKYRSNQHSDFPRPQLSCIPLTFLVGRLSLCCRTLYGYAVGPMALLPSALWLFLNVRVVRNIPLRTRLCPFSCSCLTPVCRHLKPCGHIII